MSNKVKPAITVFSEEHILMECPFCGKTLIKTNYQRIRKLLYEEGTPRGKKCDKCGGIAVLTLTQQAKEIILVKLSELGLTSQDDPTVKITY
jgi:hypothetical protein